MITFVHQNEYICFETSKPDQTVQIYFMKDTMKTRTADAEIHTHPFTKVRNLL